MKVSTDDTQARGIEGGTELERIVFFNDAIFAIAKTLLALDIRLPDIPSGEVADALPGALSGPWPKYLSYVISFVVIATYWMAHHGTFRYTKSWDRKLVRLHFLFLMFIAFVPFPTSVLGEYGDRQIAVMIYAADLAVAWLLLALIWCPRDGT